MFLPPNLGLEVADQVVSLEKILLEVAFNHARELLGVFLAVIESVFKERRQLLVIVLRVLHVSGSSRSVKTTNGLAEEPWLF